MIMKYQINTSIKIDATLVEIWNVFSDFKSYPEWNPFIASLTGEVKVGSIIHIDLKTMRFKPNVLKFDENKELRWKGKLLMKGLFDGEHYFQLKENKDGTTTFYHGEKFSGILVRLFKRKLERETKKGFEDMNLALKNRVERI
jgi:hypothetical protein